MKTILGLDLGTNSIGWALVKADEKAGKGEIIAAGSRIIPTTQDVLSKYESGITESQTAVRTSYRVARRLRARYRLRRERLHRVLHAMDFLPQHYDACIDYEKRLGQFKVTAPKLAWRLNEATQKQEFLFEEAYTQMLAEFDALGSERPDAIPHDWTLYYLRKRAIEAPISKHALAWILLNFNQKRGYYQLRGEEDTPSDDNKKQEAYHALKVTSVRTTGDVTKGNPVYEITLENGWTFNKPSRNKPDWEGKVRDFIVTTTYDEAGEVKRTKDGKEERSFRMPGADDWKLRKVKTEQEVKDSGLTVGAYIYKHLLAKEPIKVKGKLVHTIERKFYKEELLHILKHQLAYHPELTDSGLFKQCASLLYPNNEGHRKQLLQRNMVHLLVHDILFYQRPLKSKKSQVEDCRFEGYRYKKDGTEHWMPLKCIARSHPLFQEFRLIKFLQNLKIIARQQTDANGQTQLDVDVTPQFIKDENDRNNLFDWLNGRKSIDQKTLLKYPGFGLKTKEQALYRWNYPEEKTYPCNETRALISTRLEKAGVASDFLHREGMEEQLWHLLYSVTDKVELQKALTRFAAKHQLEGTGFVSQLSNCPPFESAYGAYSHKALKRLLPLMRTGVYWNQAAIDAQTQKRITHLLTAEWDKEITNRLREKVQHGFHSVADFNGLPEWLATYVVYNRHAEDKEAQQWKTPDAIELLKQHKLRNPIVEQVINETLMVVKDIWETFGKGKEVFFEEIHVEMGREMKNTKAERERLSKQNAEQEATNLRLKLLLSEMAANGSYESVRPYSPIQLELLKLYEEGALSAEYNNLPDDIKKISKMPQPSNKELERYRLWLEQKYRSPYTGLMIPLSRLFTADYEIEHVIPRSRYYDDSFTNKVICETAVNRLKGNKTALAFMKEQGGAIIDNGIKLMSLPEYEDFVLNNYHHAQVKKKKLLMEEVPEGFISRQLNDTRYISKEVMRLLGNIVRKPEEVEVTPVGLIITSGQVTSTLRQDWGLNDVWNTLITPRFERMNQLTQSDDYGHWDTKDGKRVFMCTVPLLFQKGFNKKRIDHRHHALDALVVALTTRNHINLLNNQSARAGELSRDDLRSKLCEKDKKKGSSDYSWRFKKPWASFTADASRVLQTTVVSIKANQRVVNKTINRYQKWQRDANGVLKKVHVLQLPVGWAVRKPLHKETIFGEVKLRTQKEVSLKQAIQQVDNIVDKALKADVKKVLQECKHDEKKVLEHYKQLGNQFNKQALSKVAIYVWEVDEAGSGLNVAVRKSLDDSFDRKHIASITDSAIQQLLLAHLDKYTDAKGKEHPELAFSPDGIEELNEHIKAGKFRFKHQPIYKVRTFEPKGNKFALGEQGIKPQQFAVAEKGTNLFFAVYLSGGQERSYATLPLNEVAASLMAGLPPAPAENEKGHRLLFTLSPNELVYVPTPEEQERPALVNFEHLTPEQVGRIYRMVSATGNQCFFLPAYIATMVKSYDPTSKTGEFGATNKQEATLDRTAMVKEVCWKLAVNRLGGVKLG